MTHRVRILKRAQGDIEELHAYALRDAPLIAARFIGDVIESLGSFPHRGAVPRDDRLREAGYRFVVFHERLIFYKVGPRSVHVYRVLHGRQSYQHLL